MNGKSFLQLVVAATYLSVMFVDGTPVVLAQKGGTAAKGGSFKVERAAPPRKSGLENQPFYFRPVVNILRGDSILKLDFDDLQEAYVEAQKRNPRLKFETVIKAFIAAERRLPDAGAENGQKIIDKLRATNNNLALALRRAFSLTEQEAKEEERAANVIYDDAARKARLPGRE
jgi:hypothetical protein